MSLPIAFEKVIDALLDESKPLPPRYLYRLSDLDDEDQTALAEIWPRIAAWRREALLEDLQMLDESDDVLWFRGVCDIALADTEPAVRANALRLISEYEPDDLAPLFIKMMNGDPGVEVRKAAALALGPLVYLGEIEEMDFDDLETIFEALLRVTSGGDAESVRRGALESLGYSSREEVAALIKNAYTSGKTDWQVSALFAMGRSANQDWEGDVIASLADDRLLVRTEAVRAAGELALRSARETLLAMLEDAEDENLHLAAIWSLSQIGGEGVSEAFEALLGATDDEDEAEFIEQAIENLEFTEEFGLLSMLDMDEDDLFGDDDDEAYEPDFEEDEEEKGSRQNGGKQG